MNLQATTHQPGVAPASRRLDVRFVSSSPAVVWVRHGKDTPRRPVRREADEKTRWLKIRTLYAAGIANLTAVACWQATPEWFHHFASWPRLARAGFQPVKYLFSAGVIGLLVLAWVLTDPLFQLLDQVSGRAARDSAPGTGGRFHGLAVWLQRKFFKDSHQKQNINAA